jgi:NO-binding membrane sensor protein with MHYT domain
MAQIHHFELGWITPTVSYVLSVLGSMLGLTLAARFRTARGRGERTWWLILAALAIGGTAIWSMHFVAMMGFSVVGTPIRYDVGLTAASAIIAIVAVGGGLAIALYGNRARNTRVLTGGVIAGLGVAAMHYTGMAAMRLNGDISYAMTRVGLSIGIAVVAASVALWLAVTVRKPIIMFVSALVMGIAVNGMHFTGMSAMSVHETSPAVALEGATATGLIIPIGLAVIFGIIGLAYALAAAPTEEDRAAVAYLAARREAGSTGVIPRQPSAPADVRTRLDNGPGGTPGAAPSRGSSALNGGSWTYRDRSSR